MDVQLVHSTVGNTELLLELGTRAGEFCGRFDSEADPGLLFAEIAENHFSDFPSMLCFVGHVDGEMKAHVIFRIENFMGHRFVNVMQYWHDDGAQVPVEFKHDVFEIVLNWAASAGIDDVRIWARNEGVAKIFEGIYGFRRREIVIMDASLREIANRMSELLPGEEKGE